MALQLIKPGQIIMPSPSRRAQQAQPGTAMLPARPANSGAPQTAPMPAKNSSAGNGAIVQIANRMGGNGIVVPQGDHLPGNIADYASMNMYKVPDSISIVVTSVNGGGAAPASQRIYVLNQDWYNNITNNNSGANSITYAYQDGFSGKVLSRVLEFGRAGVGILLYGFSLRMTVTAGGAADTAGLALSTPVIYDYDPLGVSHPVPINASSDQTRGDFDESIIAFRCLANLKSFTQFSYVIQPLDTTILTLYFTPNFKI